MANINKNMYGKKNWQKNVKSSFPKKKNEKKKHSQRFMLEKDKTETNRT